MAAGRHIEIFLLYFDAILADMCEIWTADVESHANTGQATNTAIFENSRLADGRHFKKSFISISQVQIIRLGSNLVCRCEFPFREWSTDGQSNF